MYKNTYKCQFIFGRVNVAMRMFYLKGKKEETTAMKKQRSRV